MFNQPTSNNVILKSPKKFFWSQKIFPAKIISRQMFFSRQKISRQKISRQKNSRQNVLFAPKKFPAKIEETFQWWKMWFGVGDNPRGLYHKTFYNRN